MKKNNGAALPKNVDEYLQALPDDKRVLLEKIRKVIKAAAPQAEEFISYQMPAYKYKGVLVYFGAFTNHCSLFAGKQVVKDFSTELKSFETSGATIHFTPDHPLPASLVQKIVKKRLQENELKKSAKTTART